MTSSAVLPAEAAAEALDAGASAGGGGEAAEALRWRRPTSRGAACSRAAQGSCTSLTGSRVGPAQTPRLTHRYRMRGSAARTCSGSHVLERLVRRFPQCHFYNLDKLDYCSTDRNLEAIQDAPNYTFVRVRPPARLPREAGGGSQADQYHQPPCTTADPPSVRRAASRRPTWWPSCSATNRSTRSCTLRPSRTSVRRDVLETLAR